MTKDQLARWKSMGFPFDEFYDTIAKEAPVVKPELTIKFVSATQDEKFYTVKLAFTIKNFKSKEAAIFLEIVPNGLSFVRFGESKTITFSAESNTFDYKFPVDPLDDDKYKGQNFYAKLIYEGLSAETGVFQIGKKEEKKKEEKKVCYCDRDFSEVEIKNIIVELRKENGYKKFAEVLFDLPKHEKLSNVTFESFTKNLNAIFTKYKINKCLYKIHFIAQTYHESLHFRATYEDLDKVPDNYEGGFDFQGRGIKQITHDFNYLEYYDKVKGTDFFENKYKPHKIGEGVTDVMKRKNDPDFGEEFLKELKTFAKRLSTEIDTAFDSAGWFWDKNNINKKAESDSVIEVTKAINGNVSKPNGLPDRTKYTKQLKEIMNYEKCNSNN
jgi:predicted chitinase